MLMVECHLILQTCCCHMTTRMTKQASLCSTRFSLKGQITVIFLPAVPMETLYLQPSSLKFFLNSIVQAYEYTKSKIQNDLLIERNQNLSFQSKTDELTKILNRRGFMQYGQQLLDTSLALAIQTEAKVLKAAFRDSDLIGRLSGDEFGVVAPGSVVRKVDVLRERLIGLNKKLSEEAGLPFTLSISVGLIEFTNENSDLQKLLQDADQQLYEEKHVKHGKND